MKKHSFSALLLAIACGVSLAGLRAETASTDPVEYAKTHKMSSYKPTTRTLAQALVDELPKKFPEVQYGVIHAQLPGSELKAVIASHNPAQVGALDDDFDAGVTERQNIYINPRKDENYARTIIIIALKDASGKVLHASWSLYLHAKPGADQVKLLTTAVHVRDEMAKEIPSLDALYQPAGQ